MRIGAKAGGAFIAGVVVLWILCARREPFEGPLDSQRDATLANEEGESALQPDLDGTPFPRSTVVPRGVAPAVPDQTDRGLREDVIVQGRVLSEDGSSLIEARISLSAEETPLGETYSMASGRYELALVDAPCGPVNLLCEAPGHRDFLYENVIVPGRYDFSMQPAGWSACGSIIGNRFDDPIPGAVVRLSGDGEVLGSQVSDENGRFCFTRLGEGIYRCVAVAPGFEAAFAGFSLVGGCEAPDLTLRLGWTDRFLSVQVVEAGTSRPVVDALVTGVLGEDYRTDGAGMFSYPVPTRAELVTVTAEGFCTERHLLHPADSTPMVEMEREQTFGVLLLVAEDLLPVVATMAQQPPRGLPERRRECTLSTLEDGRVLAVSEGLGLSLPVTTIVSGPRIRRTECTAAAWLDRSRVDGLPVCQLEAGQVLRGRVLESLGGQPVTSASVAIFERGKFEERSRMMSPSRLVLSTSAYKATTDATGAFLLRGLPQGPLDLVVACRGYQLAALPIQVPSPQELVVVLALESGERGDIGGRFLSADEKPWARSIVRAIDAEGFRTSVMTDELGEFRFGDLPAGIYKLGISVLRGTDLKGWTCKEPFQPGTVDLVIKTPWTIR